MSAGSWTAETVGAVTLLGFRHPPLDTISHRDVEQLEGALEDAAASGSRVVVLHGGPDVFVRHADLDDLEAMSAGRPTSGDPLSWIRVLRLLDRGPLLSIAAVEGQAWGGGLEIALTCNLRVLGAGATLAFPEVALGIIPGVAAHRLIRLVPSHVALRLLATCEAVTAQEAVRLGLTDTVVPAGSALVEAVRLAEVVAGLPVAAVDAVRELVLGHRDSDERDLRRRQSELWTQCAAEPDSRARVLAARAAYAAGADSYDAIGVGRPTPEGGSSWAS